MIKELNHPNIVTYKGLARLIKRIGSGYMESLLIFMEYCERNMYELVLERSQRREHFTEEEILAFLKQMIDPLEKLERWGIAHRDIKLQNVLVSQNIYKLCDF
jgi:protein kinase